MKLSIRRELIMQITTLFNPGKDLCSIFEITLSDKNLNMNVSGSNGFKDLRASVQYFIRQLQNINFLTLRMV